MFAICFPQTSENIFIPITLRPLRGDVNPQMATLDTITVIIILGDRLLFNKRPSAVPAEITRCCYT